jgi:hypothetical protein
MGASVSRRLVHDRELEMGRVGQRAPLETEPGKRASRPAPSGVAS